MSTTMKPDLVLSEPEYNAKGKLVRRGVEIFWVPRPASKPDVDSPLLPVLARLGAKLRRQAGAL